MTFNWWLIVVTDSGSLMKTRKFSGVGVTEIGSIFKKKLLIMYIFTLQNRNEHFETSPQKKLAKIRNL